MRIAASLGVFVATGLLGHTAAQATDYGNPNGSPVGSSPGFSGNPIPGDTEGSGNPSYPSNTAGSVPGSLPSIVGSGSPGSVPGGVPGSIPDSPSPNVPGAGSVIIPGSFPTNEPQNIPGSPGSPNPDISDLPACPFRSTKTVVVTVYPTDTQSGSDFPWPDDTDSDESQLLTPLPTNPGGLTSLMPASSVPPFTTLTLDIWGPDGSPTSSDTGTDDGTGSGDSGDLGDGNSPGDDNSTGGVHDPNEGSDSSNSGPDSGSDSGTGNGSGSDGEDSSQNKPDAPSFSQTPNSNGAPVYSDGSSGDESSVGFPGASGTNTNIPTPFPAPGSPSNGGIPDNQPHIPSAGPAQEASDSLPVTTQAGPQDQGENSPWFTNVPGGNGAGQPFPFSITITGPDGLPTVISSGSNKGPGQGQPPTAPGSPQNGNNPGLPGEVPSGFHLPPPVFTGVPGSEGSSNSQIGPLPGSGPEGDITTCATFTITGIDGLPTVVDSTWVVPSSTPSFEESSQLPVTGIPQASLSGIPIDVGSIPTGPVPMPGSPQDGSGSSGSSTCTSYTIIGTDGIPTVVHSTWAVPVAISGFGGSSDAPGSDSSGRFLTISGLSTFAPDGIPGSISTSSNLDNTSPLTTFTRYTVIGTDGLTTVVGTTLVFPGPTNTDTSISVGTEGPSGASDALSNGAAPTATMQTTGAPELPSSSPSDTSGSGSGDIGSEGITTCTSYTITGPDGLPIIVDSTWIIPGSLDTQSGLPSNPSFVSDSPPPGLPTGNPGTVTGSPGLPSDGDGNTMSGFTTCITYTVIGTDGLPTVVDSTFVLPTGTATPVGPSLSLSTPIGGNQADSSLGSPGAFTTITTAVVLGPDGKPTPTEHTIVFSDSSVLGVSADVPQGTTSGIASPVNSGPVINSGDLNHLSTNAPSLNGYNDGIPDASMSGILTDASAGAEGTSASGTTTGTFTWTITSVVDTPNGPVFSDGAEQPPFTSNPSGDGVSDQLPQTAYGPIASENTLWPLSAGPATLQTTTWTNVIKAETTSYTIDYPLTTLATITAPGQKLFRRHGMFWSNSTTSASSAASSTATETTSKSSSPSICATGGNIGNNTIDFDNSKPGPLFNPVENIWFSGGFLIAPPSTRQSQPYIPSSGGQLVEFVPPVLSNTTSTISGDVAQIGVGPHAASPCFRFDFFGASLGCDAYGDEKWCELEISAYRWNETSSTEESIAWSETRQVPACPTFSKGGYELTRVELDGYKDLSSVLITLRVSQNLRVWWGDDFRVGWSDNSCIAASCRTNVPSQLVKRETVLSALRQGVYQWTPHELKRLEDGLV
ncbi:hypothetical protein FBEOM_8491 [Fusarium beomiforme]|uniref:DUF7371 domain-containing protein n=1 Tax=Fusarium beomiforme TaxID=44412 RepID=A0A9P5AG37_9HYPO|nr:hypothetical protein FBEOM_8491 [Fusarium beomiforme]